MQRNNFLFNINTELVFTNHNSLSIYNHLVSKYFEETTFRIVTFDLIDDIIYYLPNDKKILKKYFLPLLKSIMLRIGENFYDFIEISYPNCKSQNQLFKEIIQKT